MRQILSGFTPPRGLIFSAACVVIFCCAGISSFSVFVDPLAQATSASRSQIILSLALYQFIMSVFCIFSGRIADRSDPKKLMYAGGLLLGLGWALAAHASSLGMLYFALSVVGAVGVGLLYTPVISTALRWYPEKRGTMSGVLLSSASMGSLIMAQVGALLCQHFGTSGLLYVGALYFVLIWAVGWLMRLPPYGWRPHGWEPPPVDAQNAHLGGDCSPGFMIKTCTFWFMLLLFSLACVAGVMMVSMLSPIAQIQLNLSPVTAAHMVSINCLANFVGRLSLGRLSDVWGESKTLALIFAMTAFSLWGLGQTTSIGWFVFFLVLLGGAFGGVLVVFPPLTAKTFGMMHAGINYGLLFFGYTVGALLGPQIAALAMEPSLGAHAFGRAYDIAQALAVAGLVLSLLFVRRERRRGGRP